MKYEFKSVPMLDAIDLPRVIVDSMDLEELENHANHVVETISGIDAFIKTSHNMSAFEASNARNLYSKLKVHLARITDLIQSNRLLLLVHQSQTIAGSERQTSGLTRFLP